MRKLFHSVILVFIIALSHNSFCQNAAKSNISGRIIDGDNGAPLEYATVSVYKVADSTLLTGVITDAQGNFNIEVSNGKYYLVMQFMGYTTVTKSNVNVNGAAVNTGKTILYPDSALLDEVEIVAEKSTMTMTLDKRVFNVGKDVSSTSGNAIDVLENVPSVTVDVEGNVSLRGDEGVQILIDGKVSGLVGVSTQDALRSLQADMIEKIEVVTNPSVKYDAEGTAGIINIVLKKDKRSGFNGSVNLRGGFPIDREEKFFRSDFPFQAGAGVALNYRLKRFNIFGNYNYNYNDNIGRESQESESFSPEHPYDGNISNHDDAISSSEQNTVRQRNRKGHTVRAGFDYYISDDDIFSFGTMYRQGGNHNTPIVNYIDKDFITGENNFARRAEDWHSDIPMIEFTADFDKYFGSKENYLKASARYFNTTEHEWSDINDDEFLTESDMKDNINPIFSKLQTTDKTEKENNFQGKVDFSYHLGTSVFEAGGKYTARLINDNTLITEDDVILEDYTHDFDFNQQVASIYGIYGKDFGRFSIQAGLRGEYTYVFSKLKNNNETHKQSFADVFPSGHVNYKLNETNQLQVSYTRRIRRPGYWQMGQFSSFNDDRNLRLGNPDLKPSYTDSYELSYLFFGKNANANLTGYYRHSRDVSRWFTEKIEEVFITTPENFGLSDDYGIELTGSYTIFKWWSINGNANFFKSVVTGDHNDEHIVSDSYRFHGRAAMKFDFKKIINIQLTGHYHSPHDEPLAKHNGNYSLDAALSRDVLGDNATITLNVRDVFGSRKHGWDGWDATFWRHSDSSWGTTTVNLNFSYRFNQSDANRRKMNKMQNDDFEEEGEE